MTMGDHTIPFGVGDLLIVDNLKLHGLARFDGLRRRILVSGITGA